MKLSRSKQVICPAFNAEPNVAAQRLDLSMSPNPSIEGHGGNLRNTSISPAIDQTVWARHVAWDALSVCLVSRLYLNHLIVQGGRVGQSQPQGPPTFTILDYSPNWDYTSGGSKACLFRRLAAILHCAVLGPEFPCIRLQILITGTSQGVRDESKLYVKFGQHEVGGVSGCNLSS